MTLSPLMKFITFRNWILVIRFITMTNFITLVKYITLMIFSVMLRFIALMKLTWLTESINLTKPITLMKFFQHGEIQPLIGHITFNVSHWGIQLPWWSIYSCYSLSSWRSHKIDQIHQIKQPYQVDFLLIQFVSFI